MWHLKLQKCDLFVIINNILLYTVGRQELFKNFNNVCLPEAGGSSGSLKIDISVGLACAVVERGSSTSSALLLLP